MTVNVGEIFSRYLIAVSAVAAVFGLTMLLMIAGIRARTHYLVIAYPLPFVWLAWLLLTYGGVRLYRAALALQLAITIRPADANETAEAWRVAMTLDGPSVLLFSRQDLPVLDRSAAQGGVANGAYGLSYRAQADQAIPPR